MKFNVMDHVQYLKHVSSFTRSFSNKLIFSAEWKLIAAQKGGQIIVCFGKW